MLGLKLRSEFETDHMRDTAIVFHRADRSGALDIGAESFFEITYPTEDVQRALLAISDSQKGRPVVLLGDRGRGKSHILAVLHYVLESPDVVERWAQHWGDRLNAPRFRDVKLKRGFLPITEAVHNNEYEYLWDLLFERHPLGQKFYGKWLQLGVPVPPKSLLRDMFTEQPAAVILDEFQTWFDGQRDEPESSGAKRRSWAFNLTQILSELANERPDILILVISVRNNETDAFRQVQRDNPIIVDFKGAGARQDRKRLALHRLFQNRRYIDTDSIRQSVRVHANERIRLLHSTSSITEHQRLVNEVCESWPFSPELFDLLEDQILLSAAAQGSRDLIRVLASIYRECQNKGSIITPADFSVDQETGGVASLLDALADAQKEKLREIAQRNLEEVTRNTSIPHAREIISAIWLRSIAPGQKAGATPSQLQVDITRDDPIDDNAFADELGQVQEHSFNIHRVAAGDVTLCFRVEENAESRLKSHARNDKLFENGKDIDFLRSYLKGFFAPMTSESDVSVIVMGPDWQTDPWKGSDLRDRPENWEQPALIVLPEVPSDPHGTLGGWLAKHVVKNRNMVRFLLPESSAKPLYLDREILVLARATLLSSENPSDPEYKRLHHKFEGDLRDRLSQNFRRFAIIRHWDYNDSSNTRFAFEPVQARGNQVPEQVEKGIRLNLFDSEAFESKVRDLASSMSTVGRLLSVLREPPSRVEEEAIPYIGEKAITEHLVKMAARGDIYLNVDGTWYGRRPEHKSSEETLQILKQKTGKRGKELHAIKIALPSAVGSATQAIIVDKESGFQLTRSDESGQEGSLVIDQEAFQSERKAAEVTTNKEQSGETVEMGLDIPRESAKVARVLRTQPKSGLNLSAEFETWGFKPSDKIPIARLEFSDLTVQELRTLLQKLPPIVKATLEVSTYE